MRFGTIDRVGGSRLGHAVAACLALVAVLVLRSGTARADNVSTLVDQLAHGDDYKARLSAAIALSKYSDPRAVQAFIDALGNDDDKNVRGAAAIGLSKVVNSQTPKKLVKAAVDALQNAKDNDSSSFVQGQAAKALATLQSLQGGGGGGGGNAAGIYVNVGAMSAKTDEAEKMRNLMRSTTLQVFSKVAASMSTSWAGGAVPTRKQLDAKGVTGYAVDGTLTDLTAKEKSGQEIVSCKVSMYITTFPENSAFGFASGGASVQATTDASDVEGAKSDCVSAVVEDLVQHKIVPTIQTRSGKP
jgi:hypothetical protein